MELSVKFTEINRSFPVSFDEVVQVASGDYNEGYDDGLVDGEAFGWMSGWDEGYYAGEVQGYKAGYDAGKAEGGGSDAPNLMNYISSSWSGNFKLMFYQAAFPDGYEVTLDIPNAPTNINSMFRLATGLRKITFTVPVTDRQYDARYFLTTDSSATPTLEELVLPDGIKFSAFDYFASYARKLHTITGTIDLSESTSNLNCFMYCTDLVNVRFAENSIKSSLYIKQSANLSDDSIDSIVNGLATVETAQTLTVNAAVAGKMTDAQKATITAKNWTLVS